MRVAGTISRQSLLLLKSVDFPEKLWYRMPLAATLFRLATKFVLARGTS